jgi:hypothetical protein
MWGVWKMECPLSIFSNIPLLVFWNILQFISEGEKKGKKKTLGNMPSNYTKKLKSTNP